MILANMGLTKILAVSVPVLNAIYPIAIMLIVLAMLDKMFMGNKMVYSTTILFTGVVSVVDALNQAGITIGFLVNAFSKLPLYAQGLGWIVPAVFGMAVGYVLSLVNKDKAENKQAVMREA